MAQVLDEFPSSTRSGRPSKYPWSQWTDGQVWKAVHGEDFVITPKMFAHQLQGYCQRNKPLKVRTAVDAESVTFQFYKEEG